LGLVSDVLIVSPHLDDAVLSCWALLTRPAGAARNVTVLDVCAGFPDEGVLGAWDERGGATSSRERVAERRAEEAAALAHGGVRIVFLDLLDWQYGPQGEDVATALAPHLGVAGEVLVPAGIGGHRDHLRVRDAALALRHDAMLYADLPYALRHGFEPPLPGYAPGETLLDGAESAAKVAALACYATQVPLLEADFGPVLDVRTMAREIVFARV
jgi:LmbE family N-acetylglucosaminyl deacetylase